ncbi:permease [Pseudoruegeria sp. HB172150]|uniref:permease n=1 Tax=Pseudoruegeria sp. HB172150 TaxID=2721164 RepID=UPI001551DC72|nr:permease [Pseudoruegeria sp. HB172150]
MTLIRLTGDGDDSERDAGVEIAERMFLDALSAVEAITEKIRRQELDALREMPKAASEAGAATRQLLTEKNRVLEQKKRTSGLVHGFAIDFDAARAEIGRRLARLRAAGGG